MLRSLKLIIVGLAFFSVSQTQAQKIKLLSVDQLERRMAKGKDTVYVVNFWATWCAPCIAELPHFEKLQLTYKSKPLKVLLVSTDFKSKLEKVVVPFVKRTKLKNEVFLLNEANEQVYIDKVSKSWSGALPATLIVNRSKNLRRFFEKQFTYKELEALYQSSK